MLSQSPPVSRAGRSSSVSKEIPPKGGVGSPPPPPGWGPLGIYAKSSSPPPSCVEIREGETLDRETGEVAPARHVWDRSGARLERYALQAVARRGLQRRHVQEGKGDDRGHKTTRCRRWLLPRDRAGSGAVEVWKHRDTHAAHFGGLETCGRVWACPVCSARISSHRAKEIRAAVDQWTASGGKVLFVTLTVPHTRQDDLAAMVLKYRDALTRFRSGKAWSKITGRFGFAGLIRAVEVTYGQANGWHPHIHELWLLRDLEGFPLSKVSQRWADCAERAGFDRPSMAHGCRVEVAESTEQARARLSAYLAKIGEPEPPPDSVPWGASDELAKAHAKRAKDGRFSPFDLLRVSYDSQASKAWKDQALSLFCDYVAAFHGVRQVFWSHGLKAQFQLQEVTDEEAANEHTERADLLSVIEFDQWRRILAAGEWRATVLELFERGGLEAFQFFMEGLPAEPVGVDDS